MNEDLITTYYERIILDEEEEEDRWTSTDVLIIKELIRQFLAKVVSLNKGREGTLYPENKSNPNFSGLTDTYTDEVVDTQNENYIANKYNDGVSLYMDIMSLPVETDDIQFPRGIQSITVVQGVTVMCPEITPGDVWKDTGNSKIYYLKPVETVAAVKGIPVVAVLQMFELPENAPEYNL